VGGKERERARGGIKTERKGTRAPNLGWGVNGSITGDGDCDSDLKFGSEKERTRGGGGPWVATFLTDCVPPVELGTRKRFRHLHRRENRTCRLRSFGDEVVVKSAQGREGEGKECEKGLEFSLTSRGTIKSVKGCYNRRERHNQLGYQEGGL